VLALESVPERLLTRPSGVFTFVGRGANVGDLDARVELVEETDAKDVTEAIASGCTAVHVLLGATDDGESAWSLDADFRSW